MVDCAAQEQARAKAAAVIAGRRQFIVRSSGCCRALREKIRGLGIGKDTGTAERLCGWYTRVFGREARLAPGASSRCQLFLSTRGIDMPWVKLPSIVSLVALICPSKEAPKAFMLFLSFMVKKPRRMGHHEEHGGQEAAPQWGRDE